MKFESGVCQIKDAKSKFDYIIGAVVLERRDALIN